MPSSPPPVGTRYIASAQSKPPSPPVGTRYMASAQTRPSSSPPVGTRYIVSAQARPSSLPPVGTRYIAYAQARQDAGQKMGCLRAPQHGEPCEDFHHNSSLAVIVGTFKAAVTRLMRTRCIASLRQQQQKQKVWQSRYHEHIIRNQSGKNTFFHGRKYVRSVCSVTKVRKNGVRCNGAHHRSVTPMPGVSGRVIFPSTMCMPSKRSLAISRLPSRSA